MPIRYCVPETIPAIIKIGSTTRIIRANWCINIVHSFRVAIFLRVYQPPRTHHIFRKSYRCITLCTCSSTISLASSRNRRGSLYLEFHRVRQNTVFEWRAVSITRQRNPYPASTCTNFSQISSLSSRTVHMINDCLLSIDNCGCLIRLCFCKEKIRDRIAVPTRCIL